MRIHAWVWIFKAVSGRRKLEGKFDHPIRYEETLEKLCCVALVLVSRAIHLTGPSTPPRSHSSLNSNIQTPIRDERIARILFWECSLTISRTLVRVRHVGVSFFFPSTTRKNQYVFLYSCLPCLIWEISALKKAFSLVADTQPTDLEKTDTLPF
jgi:hypothetical protein